jgi:hypothetical protein
MAQNNKRFNLRKIIEELGAKRAINENHQTEIFNFKVFNFSSKSLKSMFTNKKRCNSSKKKLSLQFKHWKIERTMFYSKNRFTQKGQKIHISLFAPSSSITNFL